MNHVLCLSLLLAGTVLAGEVPYGHRDFYPSSQRPIGYNADGSNCFPGATPVTEWWDGTVTTVEIKHPKTPGRMVTLPAFADNKARNVVWKVRPPGSSDAQPAVIGDRLVAVCHPDHVVCLDAHTGRILWQHRVGPLLCDGLPEETAERLQERFDLARLQSFLKPDFSSRIEADPAAAAAWQERMQRMTARITELEQAGFGKAAVGRRPRPTGS